MIVVCWLVDGRLFVGCLFHTFHTFWLILPKDGRCEDVGHKIVTLESSSSSASSGSPSSSSDDVSLLEEPSSSLNVSSALTKGVNPRFSKCRFWRCKAVFLRELHRLWGRVGKRDQGVERPSRNLGCSMMLVSVLRLRRRHSDYADRTPGSMRSPFCLCLVYTRTLRDEGRVTAKGPASCTDWLLRVRPETRFHASRIEREA